MCKKCLSVGLKRVMGSIHQIFMRVSVGVSVFLFSMVAFAETDELANAKAQVAGTFGSNSTFMHIMYTIEVIMAMYLYHKTRNIAVFIGIAVLAMFANFALTQWGINAA